MTAQPDPTRYTRAIQPDLAWMHEQCLAYCDQLPEALMKLAHRYLERLSSEKAQLEWCLPLWLAQSLGVSRDVARTMGVTNVLGMIYVRIQNDVMDGDVASEDVANLLTLSSLLYTRCLRLFTTVFAAESPFWGYLQACLQEWAAAIAWERQGHYQRLARYTEEEILWVTAGKGAPEKICCAGLAILADREGAIPHLAKALDLRSTIAQLFDDFCDWREDWQRGRYNIFLSMVLTENSSTQPTSMSLAQLYTLIYRSRQAITLFDRTDQYALMAQESVAELACEPITMLCHKAASMSQIYRQVYEQERKEALHQKLTRLADILRPTHTELSVVEA